MEWETKEPPLDVFIPAGLPMNKTYSDKHCMYCADDGWVTLKKHKQHSQIDTAICQWCEWGRVIAARMRADGWHAEFFDYKLDDIEPNWEGDKNLSDVQKKKAWHFWGFERRQDGSLVRLETGEPIDFTIPEDVLPPLPDGSRPPEPPGEGYAATSPNVTLPSMPEHDVPAQAEIDVQPGRGPFEQALDS